jgi:hypothetical protein
MVINPHQKGRTYMSKEDVEADNMRFYPLAITTGHIIFPEGNTDQELGKNTNPEKTDQEIKDEPTNYYYCGTDWHDASQKCQNSCPSGSGCPSGQRCFAECRNCPSSNRNHSGNSGADIDQQQQQRNVEYHTTVAGGWPSICTIWSQGQITMHTITAEKELNDITTSTKKKQPSSSTSKLQLRQLWNVSILSPDDRESYYRENGTQPILELEDVAIAFVDPISSAMIFSTSSSPSNDNKKTETDNHGIVLATGTVSAFYYQANEHRVPDYDHDSSLQAMYSTFVIAYDAYTGQRIWHTTSSYEMEHLLFYPDSSGSKDVVIQRDVVTTITDPVRLPRHGPISSILRRRSGMVNLQERQMIMDESTYQEYEQLKRQGTTSNINCLKEYRRSIFTTAGTLPYQFDGTDGYGTKIVVTHFDHQGITSTAASKQHHHKHPFNKHSWQKKTGKAKKSKKQSANQVEYGRPNVVVVHNFQGIHVHALRNGRSICHISLSDRTVYDDVDHDGTIDSVQLFNIEEFKSNVPTDREVDDDGVIAQNKLYDMIQEQLDRQNISGSTNSEASFSSSSNKNGKDASIYGKDVVPCYALSITSGLASVEPTHFHSMKCHTTDSSIINHAPILLIDHPIVSFTSHHHPDHVQYYKDVVVALNNGMIGRLHGKYGNWLWKNDVYESMQHRRDSKTNIPTWDDASMVALEQLYVNHYQSIENPIVLVGQDGIAILSSMSGRVVATTALPQISTIQRPYIFDINGDGTSDIVIVTNDAIWGYTIRMVRTTNGLSTSYRLLVGFTILGLMLAYLRNRFGPRPGKRSTDL